MGGVYRAEHPDIGRKVAVKVLDPQLGDHPEVAKRFLTEARAIARIEHPNIIDIFDFGRTLDGQLYYVMELLSGVDLRHVLDERGAMSPLEARPYLDQICDGLQAAHDHGVIHRDLKPENIYLLDSSRLLIKIIDFGIARLDDPDFKGPARTAKGVVMGTPLTIAPEQGAGQSAKIGPRTDLYSLGVIVYWMLAGRPPFVDEPPAVILARHITDPPPPLRDLAANVPGALAELVHRCLAKEPDERPGSAAEIARAYNEALGPAAAAGEAPSVSRLMKAKGPPSIASAETMPPARPDTTPRPPVPTPRPAHLPAPTDIPGRALAPAPAEDPGFGGPLPEEEDAGFGGPLPEEEEDPGFGGPLPGPEEDPGFGGPLPEEDAGFGGPLPEEDAGFGDLPEEAQEEDPGFGGPQPEEAEVEEAGFGAGPIARVPSAEELLGAFTDGVALEEEEEEGAEAEAEAEEEAEAAEERADGLAVADDGDVFPTTDDAPPEAVLPPSAPPLPVPDDLPPFDEDESQVSISSLAKIEGGEPQHLGGLAGPRSRMTLIVAAAAAVLIVVGVVIGVVMHASKPNPSTLAAKPAGDRPTLELTPLPAMAGGGEPEAEVRAGEKRYVAGDLVGALRHYRAALQAAPRHGHALFRRGEARQARGDFAEARADYKTALEADAALAAAVHFKLGEIHETQGQASQAIAEYRAAIEADPAYAAPRVSLGFTYARLRRYEEALEQLDKAVELAPRDALAHYYRGTVLFNVQREDDAVASYKRALALKPRYAEAHYYLGQVYVKQGQTAAARAEFQAALKANPGYEAAVLALSKLK